jgi:glycine/D-amino acid oxidase-like deaminating enzyme
MLRIHPELDQSIPPDFGASEGVEASPPSSKDWCERVDVAVIGGGITGVSAAYHLAGAARVAVLEAFQIGRGASGRAFGQVVPYLKHGSAKLISVYGRERGERVIAEVAAGPDIVFELISRHQIACHPVRTGLLFAARNRTGLQRLEETCREWRQRGAPVEMLDAAATFDAVGSRLYAGAYLDGRGGHLNPLGYTRGLARAAVERGALLYAATPVRQINRLPNGLWRVSCGDRTLFADAVVIATNAYTSDLWPGLRRTLVPVQVHGALTGTLASEALARILPGNQPLTDTRRLYSGIRKAGRRLHLTTDGALFAGRTASLDGARKRLAELFPWLPTPAFVEQWRGWIALTPDQLPHVHELAAGLWAGLGYSGRGIAAATIIGRDLAGRALGRADSEATFPLTPLRPLASRTAAALAVAGVFHTYRLLDRLDEMMAKRGSASRRSPDRAASWRGARRRSR